MPRDLIIVGAGEYWLKLVLPCLPDLRKQGLIDKVTTVDITEKEPTFGTTHLVRDREQPLSEVVDKTGYENPLTILSHANNLHTSEAVEVMENSESKPKVLIEKPYAVDNADLISLENLLKRETGNIGLLEYFLTMKGVPLLIFGGRVRQESFYFEHNGILKELSPGALKGQYGKIEETIGQPICAVSEVLDGERSYGTIEHRNLSLVDRVLGGGMIQDLGHHALTPLMALEDYIGRLDSDSLKEVKVAFCKEYAEFARSKGIPEERIGESYAELKLTTSTGIPLNVSLGKYVEKGNNQRRIIITGTRGVVLYDMTNNILAYQHGDSNAHIEPLLEADKKGVPKYLAVLRAGIECVEGKNPFYFNPVDIAFNAQKIVLDALARSPDKITKYSQGTMHDEIFK